MPRKYEKVQELLPEVQRLNAVGYTHRCTTRSWCWTPFGQLSENKTDTAGIAVPVC